MNMVHYVSTMHVMYVRLNSANLLGSSISSTPTTFSSLLVTLPDRCTTTVKG